MTFLRDDLRLTSVKDGCSEGACGTCSVLVDGKVTKSCIQKVSRFVGKKILTVEGIDPEEMAVYEYCFGEMGAVQCGFCIPGMIIAAKGLIDVNNDPTVADIKKAIRGNICRCTVIRNRRSDHVGSEILQILKLGSRRRTKYESVTSGLRWRRSNERIVCGRFEFWHVACKAVCSNILAIVNKIDISRLSNIPIARIL